jgi:hypothetical protein
MGPKEADDNLAEVIEGEILDGMLAYDCTDPLNTVTVKQVDIH